MLKTGPVYTNWERYVDAVIDAVHHDDLGQSKKLTATLLCALTEKDSIRNASLSNAIYRLVDFYCSVKDYAQGEQLCLALLRAQQLTLRSAHPRFMESLSRLEKIRQLKNNRGKHIRDPFDHGHLERLKIASRESGTLVIAP